MSETRQLAGSPANTPLDVRRDFNRDGYITAAEVLSGQEALEHRQQLEHAESLSGYFGCDRP